MKNKKIFLKLVNLKENKLLFDFNFCYFNQGDSYSDKIINKKLIKNCGTNGCLAGNLPQFSDEWYFDNYGELLYNGTWGVLDGLSTYFDIPKIVCNIMFFPDTTYGLFDNKIHEYWVKDCVRSISPPSDASLKEIQKHIKFIMKKCPQYFED